LQGRFTAQGCDLSLNRTKVLIHDEVEHRPPLADIVRAGSSDEIGVHFIGSVVHIDDGLGTIAVQAPKLGIDGQQRLTTAIRYCRVALGQEPAPSSMKNSGVRCGSAASTSSTRAAAIGCGAWSTINARSRS
jgi:hypothetical protein